MLTTFYAKLRAALADPSAATDTEFSREEAIRRATAVLMVDVAMADEVFDRREFARILELVGLHFQLDSDAAKQLVAKAENVASDMTSLYEFTQLLHDNLSDAEKAEIVGMLWQVAYADRQLDKHEDSLVLKISDLLHVNRARVMRLKDDARRPNRS